MTFLKRWFAYNKITQGEMHECKKKPSPESIVRGIRRKTRRKYSAEEEIRIVLEGLRGERSSRIFAVRRESILVSTTNGVKRFLRPESRG